MAKQTNDDVDQSRAGQRYVKFQFEGYLPAELAIEAHLAARHAVLNVVGDTKLDPIEYHDGKYEYFDKKATAP